MNEASQAGQEIVITPGLIRLASRKQRCVGLRQIAGRQTAKADPEACEAANIPPVGWNFFQRLKGDTVAARHLAAPIQEGAAASVHFALQTRRRIRWQTG